MELKADLNLALQCEELKHNDGFKLAVQRLYNNYLLVEDRYASGAYDEMDERELTAKIKRYALKRMALTDLVYELDAILAEVQEEQE